MNAREMQEQCARFVEKYPDGEQWRRNGLAAAIRALPCPAAASAAPAAWYRGVKSNLGPHGPDEWDVDFRYGDDQPEGEGWLPLYGKPLAVAPAPAAADAERVARELDAWRDQVCLSLGDTWASEPSKLVRLVLTEAADLLRRLSSAPAAAEVEAMAKRLEGWHDSQYPEVLAQDLLDAGR